MILVEKEDYLSFLQGLDRVCDSRGLGFDGIVRTGLEYASPEPREQASDSFQFRVVADYVHLNPARAGLAGGMRTWKI